ncbi:hypothetical protein [Rhodobacter maris]|uniref:Uncharacterized protein n=1 Tax=Rhodobacter maris TaxID=446682 RepID=A0A285T600_9RHOB|nr:hypothetical protein [Rhodobacter maris]SOC16769.1 hypothetical protein SAMN05877831_11514 [Rhodobacter maris]
MTASSPTAGGVRPEDAEPSDRLPRLSRLGLLLYPFVTAAVAINLFMLSLMGQSLGFAALSPTAALLWALPLGLHASVLAARWVRSLLAEAGGL